MSKHRDHQEMTKPQMDEIHSTVDVKKPKTYIRQICKSHNGITMLSIGKLLKDYGCKHWEIVKLRVVDLKPDVMTLEITKLQ